MNMDNRWIGMVAQSIRKPAGSMKRKGTQKDGKLPSELSAASRLHRRSTPAAVEEEAMAENGLRQNGENGNGRWDFQGDSVIFNDKSFKFYENGKEHEGTYTSMSLFDTELLQFRADEKDCILNGFFMYKLSGERLDLIAVKLSTEGCIISGKSFPIRLEKFKSN